MQDLGIMFDLVKAPLLDNVFAHQSASNLVADNGHIWTKFLPQDTSPLIQPMDHGVTVATKRLYQERFLDKVMVVYEKVRCQAKGM